MKYTLHRNDASFRKWNFPSHQISSIPADLCSLLHRNNKHFAGFARHATNNLDNSVEA
jgi:hypothetical protein